VSDSVLPTLFPHLSRFPVQNLGFMVRDGEKHDAAVPKPALPHKSSPEVVESMLGGVSRALAPRHPK